MSNCKQRALCAAIHSIFATAATALVVLPVHAQESEAPAAPTQAQPAPSQADALGLNTVVVTGVSGGKSKMRSSISVTDVDAQQIADFGPRSEAEVLHLIPGIRAESSAGPGGNSNITVRGLPIASGGSKYVQLQEDGLPVVEFGDMNFANNDYWLRYDANIARIETVRGGSASTFASHAPGAIINFLSKTGEEEGGSVAFSHGLNYKENRTDLEYGGHLSPDLRFHIGGFYRDGEGPRNSSYNTERGYQIKGNITRTFNGDQGYFRAYFKVLDDRAPTYTSMPAKADISGNTLSGFSSIPGFDILRDSQNSIYNTSALAVGPIGTATRLADLTQGISVNAKSVGFEFHNQFGGGFTVDDKFRYTSQSGAFQTQFWGLDTLEGTLAGFGAGSSAVYANGPKTGQAVTQANLATGYISNGAAIDVRTPDIGHYANDLGVARSFKLADATLGAKAGYYHSNQDIVEQWSISGRLMEVGRDGALIDIRSASGAALTSMGLTGYNDQWGACCARNYDAHYTTDAPYLGLTYARGPLDIDASVRRDSVKASGSYMGPTRLAAGVDVDGDGAITGAERNVYVIDSAHPRPINYKVGYNSYSLGANYQFGKDVSAFARASRGGRAIADRLLFSSNIDAASGQLAAGAEDAAVARVKQMEVGLKYRARRDWGSFGLFSTLYHSTVSEFDYDQTRTVGPRLNQTGYRSNGLELESVLRIGAFALNANATYTDLKITSDLVGQASGNSTVGNTPHGTPRWLYAVSPRYDFGAGSAGLSIIGQSRVWSDDANTLQVKGRYLMNGFVNYDVTPDITLSLNVNNLLNDIAFSAGVDQGSLAQVRALGAAIGAQGVVSSRPEAGRTVSLALRYRF
jgi:outer membrane receptor protein involved in Fe transport